MKSDAHWRITLTTYDTLRIAMLSLVVKLFFFSNVTPSRAYLHK